MHVFCCRALFVGCWPRARVFEGRVALASLGAWDAEVDAVAPGTGGRSIYAISRNAAGLCAWRSWAVGKARVGWSIKSGGSGWDNGLSWDNRVRAREAKRNSVASVPLGKLVGRLLSPASSSSSSLCSSSSARVLPLASSLDPVPSGKLAGTTLFSSPFFPSWSP